MISKQSLMFLASCIGGKTFFFEKDGKFEIAREGEVLRYNTHFEMEYGGYIQTRFVQEPGIMSSHGTIIKEPVTHRSSGGIVRNK